MNQLYTCTYEDHNKEPIIGYCLNKQCREKPQFCLECVLTIHLGHKQDCKGFAKIKQMIQDRIKELNKQQEELEKQGRTLQISHSNSVKSIFEQQTKMIQSRIEQRSQENERDFDCKKKELDSQWETKTISYYNKYKSIDEQRTRLIELEQQFSENNFSELKNNLDLLTFENQEIAIKRVQVVILEHEFLKFILCMKLLEIELVKSILEDKRDVLIQQSHRLQGRRLVQEGKFAEALVYYTKAVEASPNSADFCIIGRLLSKEDKEVEAIEYYDKSILISPETPDFYKFKGDSLRKLNKNNDAIASYKIALEKGYENKAQLHSAILELQK